MERRALAGRFCHGVFRSKPSSSPRACSRRVKKSATCAPDQGAMAPSPRVGDGSGTTSSGSTSIRVPRPWQTGQAPNGRVERERARLQVVGVDGVVVRAGHLLGEAQLPARVVVGQVDEVEHHQAAGKAEGGLHRVGEPTLGGLLHREPVDHDLDRVLLLLLQRRRLGPAGGSRRPPGRARSPGSAAGGRGSTYSPLRPRITGARTWKRRPSSSARTRSTICCGVCRRWARRRSGSAGGRRGRRAGGGSRRPR